MVAFCLTSCRSFESADHRLHSEEPIDSTFNVFLSQLPQHSLPVSFRCGINSSGNIKRERVPLAESYIPDFCDVIFGRLGNSQNPVVVVAGITGDDIYPVLFTYSPKGKRVDSLHLTLTPCGGTDSTFIPITISIIQTDYQLTLTDSLLHIHYPTGNDTYVLDSVTTNQILYAIDSSGRIIKQKN